MQRCRGLTVGRFGVRLVSTSPVQPRKRERWVLAPSTPRADAGKLRDAAQRWDAARNTFGPIIYAALFDSHEPNLWFECSKAVGSVNRDPYLGIEVALS